MEDFRRALATGPVVYKIVHAVEKNTVEYQQ